MLSFQVNRNCIEINTHQVKKCPLPSLLVSNVCHITNKVTELSAVISNNKSTINLIVESWLTDDVPNSFINIGDNYLIFRLDRPTPGGGVLAYIDKSDQYLVCQILKKLEKRYYGCSLNPTAHRDPLVLSLWSPFIIHRGSLLRKNMK